jgi:hypothetical protein
MANSAAPPAFSEEREKQIQLGTVMLTPRELAPRIGLAGAWAWQTVLEWARLGRLPAVRLNERQVMFHWPTVQAALAKGLPPAAPIRTPTSESQLNPGIPRE